MTVVVGFFLFWQLENRRRHVGHGIEFIMNPITVRDLLCKGMNEIRVSDTG
ncbi:hypothetical protein D3C76_1872580 [compost metagenome]